VGATVDLTYRPPLRLPTIRTIAVTDAERAILAAATSGTLIGTSLVAGRYQTAVAAAVGVLHLAAAAVCSGTAFTRLVPAERRPGIIGALAAGTTVALLTGATNAVT
jgi:hypothetical protein